MNTMDLNIDGRLVGIDHPPLVIAEIGINHGGDLGVAIEMVDAAASCGAEIVKHQTHIVDDEMSSAARDTVPGNADRSIYEIMASCALDEAAERKMMQHARSRGLIFISTPFSRAAAYRLRDFDVPAFKIGSGEMNNHPLLRLVASFGKPVIMSTGMHDLEAVRSSVSILEAAGVPYALLHTTNLYPTPDNLVRLGAVSDLAHAFPSVPVGLSDHTTDNTACLGAVALGASILERHFTDRMDRDGPDIICSMDPAACGELIRESSRMAIMRRGGKTRIPEEQVTRDFAFASVVATADIAAGEQLRETNIWVKRPGTGEIPATEYEQLLGRTARKAIAEGAQLKRSDLA